MAWGNNYYGQGSVPVGLNDVVAIATKSSHNVALKRDRTVVAWGNNDAGQASVPAGLNNVVAIAAGSQHTLTLKQDGTVLAWGTNVFGQTTVPVGLSNVIAIAAGGSGSLAIVRPLADRPTTLSAKISGGSLIFSWPAIPGRTYRLQHKSSLDEVVWTDLPGDVAASANNATASDAVSATDRFYRLVLLP